MPIVANKLRHLHREMGSTGLVWYLAALLVARLKLGRLHRYVFLAQPVANPRPLSNTTATLVVKQISRSEYQSNWFPRPDHVINERFDQGAQCLVAFSKGAPAACLWLVFDSYVEDEVRCHYRLWPAETTAWDFDVFLHPEYRLGRTFARLWDAAEKHLSAEGRHWCLSRVNAFNPSSLRAHQRRGAIAVGKATFLTLGTVQLLISGKPPYFHVSRGAHQTPCITVSAPGNMPSPATKEAQT